MNFLAHIYLSGTNNHVKVGNFIGDYVKGKKYQYYPEDIQRGILLHRNIDEFTDRSSIPKKIKPLFVPYYRKYAGIVTDLVYDHFLARNWQQYSEISLESFVSGFYDILMDNYVHLPRRVKNFLPTMIEHNRLYSYTYLKGIEHALRIMSHYTSLPDQTENAMYTLNLHYEDIHQNFEEFFQSVMHYVERYQGVDLHALTGQVKR